MGKTSKMLGFLTGQRIAGQRSKQKTIIGYSYNGTVLPALPEWDRETYPYAVISDVGYDNNPGVKYSLVVCSTAPVWHTTQTSSGLTQRKLYSDGDCLYYICYTNEGEKWVDGSAYSYVIANHTTYNGTVTRSVFPIWANTDLADYDGKALVSASDPIPVYE